jgi:predicted aspartyl protease
VKHRCQSDSPDGLVMWGPLAEVKLSQPLARPENIETVGSLTVRMMIDTGAHKTVVDRGIAEALGLEPIRFEEMVGVSHVPENCPVYLMSITIGISDGVRNSLMSFTSEMIGMATPPTPRPFNGLLGRDFLRFIRLVYDGTSGCVDLHAINAPSAPLTPARHPSRPDRTKRKAQRDARKKNRRK